MEIAGEIALRVTIAGQELAVAPELDRQPALPTLRALQLGEHLLALDVAHPLLRHRQGALERRIERLQHRHPLFLALSDLIELLLHLRGEAIIDDAGEMLHQQVGHDPAEGRRDQLSVADLDILAFDDRRQHRCIGRGAPDPQALELFHQARLGIARRRLGEVLQRQQPDQVQHFALGQRWKPTLTILVLLTFVQADVVDRQEAGEFQHRAGGPKGIGVAR